MGEPRAGRDLAIRFRVGKCRRSAQPNDSSVAKVKSG
jgi:hypothetical protein